MKKKNRMLFYHYVLMLRWSFSSKFIFFTFLHGVVSPNLQYRVKDEYLKIRNLRVGREKVRRKRNFFHFQQCIWIISPKTIRIWCSGMFLYGLLKLLERILFPQLPQWCLLEWGSTSQRSCPHPLFPHFPYFASLHRQLGGNLLSLLPWGNTENCWPSLL